MDELNEPYSLKWSDYRSEFTEGFQDMLKEEAMVDVTLAVAEGSVLQAHKLVLSVCSSYFRKIFKLNPCKHPIVILKDVSHHTLNYVLEFMYKGEVDVKQDDLPAFLNLAETLKIKGLVGEQIYSGSLPHRTRNTMSQEKRKKSHQPDSDSEPDVERRSFLTRKLLPRRPKTKTKRLSKRKVKVYETTPVKKVKIEMADRIEPVEDNGGDVSGDSDCSPLVKLIIGRTDAQETTSRLASAADESSADDADDANDAGNDDFDVPGEMFNSEGTSYPADPGLQGRFRRGRSSVLWTWYEMDDNQHVTCLLCKKCFRFYNTGHLSRHLRVHHPEQHKSFTMHKAWQAEESFASVATMALR